MISLASHIPFVVFVVYVLFLLYFVASRSQLDSWKCQRWYLGIEDSLERHNGGNVQTYAQYQMPK